MPRLTARNRELANGVNKFGRSAVSKKTMKYRFAKSGATPKPKTQGEARKVRYVNADPVNRPLRRHASPKPAKLRASITPGTVLIVLAGRFRGKRVVFLKQLESGLLLVTGPYKVNGVPLRRLNQAYVIATKTSVDISGVNVPDSVNDSFFARQSESKGTEADAEAGFFSTEIKKVEIPEERKTIQKSVDAAILASLKSNAALKAYLNARFSLTNGQKPHAMVF